jgi:hypothetical protein
MNVNIVYSSVYVYMYIFYKENNAHMYGVITNNVSDYINLLVRK